MADATVFRDTQFKGLAPARGTYPIAANTRLVKGTMVGPDASGNLVTGTAAVRIAGKCSAHFDNRTGSEAGGLAGDLDGEVEYGVFGWTCSETPRLGQMLYAVDNQTVSTDSLSGARPPVGPFSEKRDGQAFCYSGPMVTSSDAAASRGRIDVPISDLRIAAGGPLIAFNDGVADGYVVSEGFMHRFNVNSTSAVIASVLLPDDLDASQDVTVHALVSREGSADVTAALTVTAFFAPVGAAYDADANAGGATTAAAAATKVVSEVTATLDAADVPAGPVNLSLTLVPTAALDADDMNLHALWVEFARIA